MFPINTHVTPQGLVFVNFSSDPIPFDDWFLGLTTEMNEFDFSDYEYHMSYELDGKFNWKTLMDGYQECMLLLELALSAPFTNLLSKTEINTNNF